MVASPFVKSQADHTLLPFRRLVSRAEFYLRPTEIYCSVRQDMGTFGSNLRVRLRKLSGRVRALLENSSFSSAPLHSPPDSCLRTHVWCPTPRTRFINILNKIRENLNSSCGKGRLPGRKPPGGEEKGDYVRADLYIHHMSMHFHRWLCITCSYGRTGHTKSYATDFEAQGQPRAVGNFAEFISVSALCRHLCIWKILAAEFRTKLGDRCGERYSVSISI